jgi:1-acyl-sn-glycerol-3-phosphate acyltransferase
MNQRFKTRALFKPDNLMSTVRWMIGGLFFLTASLIIVFCLFFLPKKTCFGLVRVLFKILIRIMGIRLVVTGTDHINPNQVYLIMGNHQSLFDIFVIPAAIPLVFVGVEAARHFSLPVWGFLIRKWGCIPIQRSHLKNAVSSLETARKTLLSGVNIGILPEGHRTLTGRMNPFKKGPFHLAKAAGADILPFGINGLFEYQHKGSLKLNPGVVRVNIGNPVAYAEFKDLSVQENSQRIFDIIQELSKK